MCADTTRQNTTTTPTVRQVEQLAKDRCLQTFKVNTDEWGVNVQPYSGYVHHSLATEPQEYNTTCPPVGHTPFRRYPL